MSELWSWRFHTYGLTCRFHNWWGISIGFLLSVVYYVVLLQVWGFKLHKNKVTCAEFSKVNPWLLCTASLDRTVKMWDIRNVSNNDSYLCSMEHSRGVNSGQFLHLHITRKFNFFISSSVLWCGGCRVYFFENSVDGLLFRPTVYCFHCQFT